MGYLASEEEKQRFDKFTKELAALSKTYGFVLEVGGGVYMYEPNDPLLKNLIYTNDLSSQDIEVKGVLGFY
jgi:hypothetical protein